MRPKTITYTLAAADRNGLATDTLAGAGNFTLDGALASGGAVEFDSPRHVTFYSANDDSGVTFTITGTDRQGAAMTETVTGPNATTVSGSKNFATVTQVAGDAATVGDVEVGSGDSAETQWIVIDYRKVNETNTDTAISAGDMTATIEGTVDDPFSSSFDEHSANLLTLSQSFTAPVRAVRVKIESIDSTNGCTFTFTVVQS